jgi:hypothetical protein
MALMVLKKNAVSFDLPFSPWEKGLGDEGV